MKRSERQRVGHRVESDRGFEIRRERITIERDGTTILESGSFRPTVSLDVEAYGTSDTNPILVLIPALTGSASAVGSRRTDKSGSGWWDQQIGPGRVIDTDRFTLLVLRADLASIVSASPDDRTVNASERNSTCRRTTSHRAYRSYWTIRDIARLCHDGVKSLGIDLPVALIGGSFGGMVALEWGLLYPESVSSLILMATAARTDAWRYGLNHVALQILELADSKVAITNDDKEAAPLSIARQLAMLHYRGKEEFDLRFGVTSEGKDETGPSGSARDRVASYLQHHGHQFVQRIEVEEYRSLLHLLNSHDVGRDRGGVASALSRLEIPVLALSFTSDHLYPTTEVAALAQLVSSAEHVEIDSPYGHDAFLIETGKLRVRIEPFLERVTGSVKTRTRMEEASISGWEDRDGIELAVNNRSISTITENQQFSVSTIQERVS